MNLETKVTEAKLDDPSSDRSKAVLQLPHETTEDQLAPQIISKSQLKEAVKYMKGEQITDSKKEHFRSYEEIKQTLDELNLKPKSDFEILSENLDNFKKEWENPKKSEIKILNVINNLEYLSHQYDNAVEFVRQNGFEKVIFKSLNSTSAQIKRDTLRLMGSLMQNNAKVKVHALEIGAIPVLIKVINFDSDELIKSSAITALSALIRTFPVAQKKFIDHAGFLAISKLFESSSIKLQIKAVTMVSDLLIENNLASGDENLNKFYMGELELIKNVLEYNWCEHLDKLLHKIVISDKDDHYSVEQCLTAMHSLRSNCASVYQRDLLLSLQKHYELQILKEKQTEDEFGLDTFFIDLQKMCTDILTYVNYVYKIQKSEL